MLIFFFFEISIFLDDQHKEIKDTISVKILDFIQYAIKNNEDFF